MKLRQVRIDQVKVPETRVTSYFSAEIYEEFKRTIQTMGVMEPIVCVETPDGLHLVDGLHRLVEAKNKGDKTVSCVVVPGEEKDIFLTNLFLNVLRGKTKVREMRQVIDCLYKEYETPPDIIAQKTGLSEAFVQDLLQISQLPDEVVEAFDEGKLQKGKALALAQLKDPELQMRVWYQIDGRNFTVKDVQDICGMAQEAAATTPVAPPRGEAEVTRLLPCDICGKGYEIKWLKSMLVCAEDEAIMRVAYRQAAAAELNDQAAPQNVPPA